MVTSHNSILIRRARFSEQELDHELSRLEKELKEIRVKAKKKFAQAA